MFEIKNICKSFHATIHMAGDINHARQICRKFVMSGACVQVTPCEYIYTGGLETGFTVRIMNYARFPRTDEAILDMASELALLLGEELCQKSYSIETPVHSYYFEHSGYKKD